MCRSCVCANPCTTCFSACNDLDKFLDSFPVESLKTYITCISFLLWISGFIVIGVCWHLIPDATTLLVLWVTVGAPSLFLACSLLIHLCLFCMFCFLLNCSCCKRRETPPTPSFSSSPKDDPSSDEV